MWAIIPINSFKKTMTRLSEVLNTNQRIKLTKLLTQQIIDHLLDIPKIEKIVLLTNETEWAQSFDDENIILKANQDRLSLKENINQTTDWLWEQGAKQMLYLSIDLPLASKDDVINLINQHRNGLTLVIANKDGGTNALILDMPRSFPFQFGENSLEKHLLEAKSFGVETRVISIDGLSFDLDDIHDWNHLIATNKSLLNRLD